MLLRGNAVPDKQANGGRAVVHALVGPDFGSSFQAAEKDVRLFVFETPFSNLKRIGIHGVGRNVTIGAESQGVVQVLPSGTTLFREQDAKVFPHVVREE